MPVKFVLFDIHDKLVAAWQQLLPALVPPEALEHITITGASLDDLDITFDTIVSPANSFGRLDGSFDQVLSDYIAPESDNAALTHAAQDVLYRRWRGYAPAGTCTLVPLARTPCAHNKLGVRYVALCPTMRTPESVRWHKEVVYNCVWSLLAAVDNHNAEVAADPGKAEREGATRIECVAMTGLATGVGGVSPEVCARQMAQAFAHYHEATAKPEKWGKLEWGDIFDLPHIAHGNDTIQSNRSSLRSAKPCSGTSNAMGELRMLLLYTICWIVVQDYTGQKCSPRDYQMTLLCLYNSVFRGSVHVTRPHICVHQHDECCRSVSETLIPLEFALMGAISSWGIERGEVRKQDADISNTRAI